MMVKTIRLDDETHEELRELGEKGESFQAIIKRLLKHNGKK